MIKWLAVPAVALILSLASTAALAAPCAGFTDVDDTSPFCGNVTWLKNRSITLGCTSTTLFCPGDFVSRLQMAAFMNRLGDSLFPLTCAAGQVMKWDGLQWACANDAIGGGGGGGTVTSVAAGTGLTGSPNPITGAGSLNIAPGYQLPQACSNGQVPKSNGAGGWACGTDTAGTGTVTSVAAGTGLTGGTITGSGTIAADTTYLQRRVVSACAVGSSIRTINADGSVVCQVDSTGAGTVTSVATGAGLLGGPITGSGTVDLRLNAGGGLAKNLGAGTNELGVADGGITNAKIAPGTIAADRLVASQQLPNCFDGQVLRRSGGVWICGSVPPTITAVDSVGIVGRFTAVAIGTDGLPVVSYYDSTNLDLKVAKCVDAACSGSATITTVDSGGAVGQYTSIAIGTDGLPVVSYYDNSSGIVKVAKCVNAACTGSATITTVDSGAPVGQYTSIAIGTDGLPAVSYYDTANGSLKVAKCVDAACTGSATITTVDSLGEVGYFTSIAIGTDGLPVLSYYDNSSGIVKVAKCVNAACTGSATITTVDSSGFLAQYTSIAIGTDGLPVVSYYDSTNLDLKVAKCVNAACTGSATITTVDSGGAVGQYTSIAIGTDGLPVVSYYDTANGNLKVAKCVNAACTGSATITTVDSAGVVGTYTSIAIGTDGLPVVSYHDATNGDLKVVKCSNAACLAP